MEIPAFLETQTREGKVILFLGAGASYGAKNASGQTPPLGKKLGERISDRFLGGNYKDFPLNQIGELAISESDLTTVQEYLREIFEGFEPTEAHRMMTTFRWECIATTNYDLIIEKAYRQNKEAVQIAVPFIENGDRVEDKMRDQRSMMLLKLHGCVTRRQMLPVPSSSPRTNTSTISAAGIVFSTTSRARPSSVPWSSSAIAFKIRIFGPFFLNWRR